MKKAKQTTYLISASTKDERKAFLDSGLCLLRNWNFGWFDIPSNMRDEFIQKFGFGGAEHSTCKESITKQEIIQYNRTKALKAMMRNKKYGISFR